MIVSQPSVSRLLATLAAVASALPGDDGARIRGHVERLAASFEAGGRGDRGELDRLTAAVVELARGARMPGADLGELASALCALSTYLRAPTGEHQAQVDQASDALAGAVPEPALEPRQIDGRIEELALAAARGRGLTGAALSGATASMVDEIRAVIRRLERQAATRTCSDAAHRADVELELRVALDQILRGRPQATA